MKAIGGRTFWFTAATPAVYLGLTWLEGGMDRVPRDPWWWVGLVCYAGAVLAFFSSGLDRRLDRWMRIDRG